VAAAAAEAVAEGEVHGISAAEFDARCEALVLVGGIFSGETPSEAVDKAVDGLSRLTGRATQAALSARCFLGGLQHRLASEISEFRDAAATERSLPTPGQSGDACAEAEDCAAQASHAASLAAAPPADMSSFFREMFKS